METSKIKLVYKHHNTGAGEWHPKGYDYLGRNLWACLYDLDIDRTIEANSNINRDVLLDYINNKIADDLVVYTEDITDEDVDKCDGELDMLDYNSYDYYTYADWIYLYDNDNYGHNVVWVDMDYDAPSVEVEMS